MNSGVPTTARAIVSLVVAAFSTFVRYPQQEHVPRLEIAMDDPLGVRHRQGRCELLHDLRGRARLQPSDALETLLEVLAVQVLHHQVRLARRRRAEVQHLDDVRVGELGRHLHLAAEARQRLRMGGQLLRHHLDRHALARPDLGGFVDRAHPADPDRAHDLVALAQHGADRQIHRSRSLSCQTRPC
jgi:hypothetical protein